MKKTFAIAMITLIASLNMSAATAQENEAQQEYDRGDRIEHRFDIKGDRINDRMDAMADRARSNGKNRMAKRLDKKGDRIERKLKRRGNRIDRKLDRTGKRADKRFDRRQHRRANHDARLQNNSNSRRHNFSLLNRISENRDMSRVAKRSRSARRR